MRLFSVISRTLVREGSYPSAEVQSVYSTAPADWAMADQSREQPEGSLFTCYLPLIQMCPHGVMVKAMDCRIVVSEFVLQSHYYVHFQANTLGKGIILPAMC